MSQRYLSFRFAMLTINLLIIFLFGLFFYSGDVSAVKEETPVIKKIQVKDEERKIRILIEGSSSLSYTIFKLSDPLRVVVDLAGAEAGAFKGRRKVGKEPVIDILTTEKDKPGKIVRVEIGLSSPVDVTPSHQDNKLFIDIQKPSLEKKLETPSIKEEAKKPNETLQEKETKTEVKTLATKPAAPSQEVNPVRKDGALDPALSKKKKISMDSSPPQGVGLSNGVKPVPAEPAPAVVSRGSNQRELTSAVTRDEKPKKSATAVTGVRINKEKGLSVIISGDGEMGYEAFMLKPNRLVIDIPDAINKARPLTYNVGDPSLSNLRIGQHKEPKKKVRVVLYLTKPLPYEVIKEGKDLIITLKADQPPQKPTATPQKRDVANLSKKESVADKETAKRKKISMDSSSPQVVGLSPPVFAQKMEEQVRSAQKNVTPVAEKPAEVPVSGKYTGRRINLDFYDADIISILRLISEVSGMNIVASPDVKGKITVKLLNVPWDQALDIILKTHHFGKVVEDNIIRVAPVSALAKEREEIAQAKEALAKAEDLISKIIPLSYAVPKDVRDAIEKAKVLSPRGNVSIDERTNTLIVKDISKNLEEAESLIKILDKPTPQVSIEAKIVEASTDFTRELGIQWGFKYVADAAHGNPLPYTFPHSMAVGGALVGAGPTTPWAINLPAAVGVGSGGALGITFGSITNTFNLDLQLSALEGTGQGKILSNPKITTLDNKEAIIEQGEDVPYQTTTEAEGPKTEFKKAVLSLKVLPTITPGGAISMKIEVNKDSVGTMTPAGPIIITKSAKTSVLVQDGETIVIGGILTSTKIEDRAGVPLLHKIPILGWLFKKELFKDYTRELLIFITPRILKPA